MQIRLSLHLPRDEFSVPVVRRMCAQNLAVLGVVPSDIADVELALTEACTNAAQHAVSGQDFEIVAEMRDDVFVVEVVDRGGGFGGSDLGHAVVEAESESGRGIALMRALVDDVSFVEGPGQGSRVHLEKQLQFLAGAAYHRLGEPVTGSAAAPVEAPAPVEAAC